MLATLVDLVEAEPARLAKLRSLRSLAYGAAPMPTPLLRRADSLLGVEFAQGYGMTELSGNAVFLNAAAHRRGLEGESGLLEAAGEPAPGVELRLVDDDDNELPWDGVAVGALKVRGLWVCRDYYRLEGHGGAHDAHGWFSTGDVCSIDPSGFMRITDRAKDVIKSGGEWISSIDLENTAMGHPAVAEAAVIGVAHPKWQERPLLVVVHREGMPISKDELLAWFDGRVAKWWIPDDVVFVKELPHTATGKLSKLELRKRLGEYRLPDAD